VDAALKYTTKATLQKHLHTMYRTSPFSVCVCVFAGVHKCASLVGQRRKKRCSVAGRNYSCRRTAARRGVATWCQSARSWIWNLL